MKKSKVRILLTFILLVVALSANAQSKPKRDTSKDKSAVVAKKQKEKAAPSHTALVAKQNKQKKSKRRKRIAVEKSSASYLMVNNESSPLSYALKQNGGNMTFDVRSDGEEWTIHNLPSWCKVTKYSNSFLLEYEANSSFDERKECFSVNGDSKEVWVNLSQAAIPVQITTKVSSAYLNHNVYSSTMGCFCLEIHATVTLIGAAGHEYLVNAYIIDSKKNYITAKQSYPAYMQSSSNPIICTSAKVTPSRNNPQSFDIVMYLPNNALNLKKKKNELYCMIRLWNPNVSYLEDTTSLVYFKAKSKRGVVTTESY